MTTLWLIRHGPTHAKAMVGWTDLPADLSDKAALERLNAYLPDKAAVISSDLSRAVSTADALMQPGRTRLPHDPDLREIHFGTWEMQTAADIEARDPERIRAFWDRPGEVRPPDGEAWNTVYDRVSAAVDRVIAAHTGDIIVVAHFGAILTQIQRAERLDAVQAFAHRIDPLSVTRLDVTPDWQMGVINHQP